MSLGNWDKSNLLQFAVTEACSGSSSRADMCYWQQAAVSQDADEPKCLSYGKERNAGRQQGCGAAHHLVYLG